MKNNQVYQFKISLNDIAPVIWRRIHVPAQYSFWDLHVAIQDAMGWQDYHLHLFSIKRPHAHRVTEIGIPDENYDDITILPSWETDLWNYFTHLGVTALYTYDFGDNWRHDVLLEGELLKEQGVKYPRCLGGEGKCPPEDCGGISGYFEFLEAVLNPFHPEHHRMVEWCGCHYDPNDFDYKKVTFENPKKRWRRAFQHS